MVEEVASQGHITSVAQPVLNKQKQPIGAMYGQVKSQGFNAGFFSVAGGLLFTVCSGLSLRLLSARSLARDDTTPGKATSSIGNGNGAIRVGRLFAARLD